MLLMLLTGMFLARAPNTSLMATVSLLDEIPNPSESDVRLGLEGNLCRCTGYHNIVKSVLAAAETMRGAK